MTHKKEVEDQWIGVKERFDSYYKGLSKSEIDERIKKHRETIYYVINAPITPEVREVEVLLLQLRRNMVRKCWKIIDIEFAKPKMEGFNPDNLQVRITYGE